MHRNENVHPLPEGAATGWAACGCGALSYAAAARSRRRSGAVGFASAGSSHTRVADPAAVGVSDARACDAVRDVPEPASDEPGRVARDDALGAIALDAAFGAGAVDVVAE